MGAMPKEQVPEDWMSHVLTVGAHQTVQGRRGPRGRAGTTSIIGSEATAVKLVTRHSARLLIGRVVEKASLGSSDGGIRRSGPVGLLAMGRYPRQGVVSLHSGDIEKIAPTLM